MRKSPAPPHCRRGLIGGANTLARKRRLVLGELNLLCQAFGAQHADGSGICGARPMRPGLLCVDLGRFDANPGPPSAKPGEPPSNQSD